MIDRWRTSLMTTLLLAACSGSNESSTTPTPEPAPQVVRDDLPHVVLVTLDTTRADRLGAYGYDKADTPVIDALAARGRRYERAYSPLPLTIPSHSSIMTGRTPGELGVRDNGQGLLRDAEITLAEVLHGEGYVTGASVAAFVTTRYWGFSQGFDLYFDEIDESEDFWHASRPAEEVIDDALLWKDRQVKGRPQFLWVHLYDAHTPYSPPEGYLDKEDPRPYDGELAYIDDQLERLVQAYGDEPTLFVVVGDHGEGLGQHGELQHGLYIYEQTQHVPLILAGPGVETEVVDQVVTLRDVMPTVLSQLEIEPPATITGQVVPSAEARPACLEAWQLRSRFGFSPHLGVVDGDYKLIDLPSPELYNVTADPGEETNLAETEPKRIEAMKSMVEQCGFVPPENTETEGVLDPELVAKLEALGYAQGGFAGELDGELPDPKEHQGLIRKMQRIQFLRMEDKKDEAIALLEGLADEYPDVVEIRTRLATLYGEANRVDDALRIAQEALEIQPDHPALMQVVGGLLARSGRFQEAAELLTRAADMMPYHPRARSMAVAALLSADQDQTEAMKLGLQYLEEYPEDYMLAGVLGVARARRQDYANAEPLLRLAAKADVPGRGVHLELSKVAMIAKKESLAREHLEKELEYYPENRMARQTLMRVAGTQKDWATVAAVAKDHLDRGAKDIEVFHARTQALFNLKDFAACREELDRALERYPESSVLILLDANLMAKEGKQEAGQARFEAAKTARAAERDKAVDDLRRRAERAEKGLPPEPPSLPGAAEAAPSPKAPESEPPGGGDAAAPEAPAQ